MYETGTSCKCRGVRLATVHEELAEGTAGRVGRSSGGDVVKGGDERGASCGDPLRRYQKSSEAERATAMMSLVVTWNQLRVRSRPPVLVDPSAIRACVREFTTHAVAVRRGCVSYMEDVGYQRSASFRNLGVHVLCLARREGYSNRHKGRQRPEIR